MSKTYPAGYAGYLHSHTRAQFLYAASGSMRLTRLLRRETELTFQTWRDQIRTFIAIPLLTEGRPLLEIADLLGYETAWAFTAMFKRVTGKVPSQYSSS